MVSNKYILEVLSRLSKLDIQEAYQGNATIEFYKSPNGNNPVKEFLDNLDPLIFEEVDRDIDKLREQGANAKYPLIDNLGNKIFELRTRVNKGKGNNWVRILYFWMPGNKIVFTHGIIKKSNKTPPGDIEIAIERRKKYLKDIEKERKPKNNRR